MNLAQRLQKSAIRRRQNRFSQHSYSSSSYEVHNSFEALLDTSKLSIDGVLQRPTSDQLKLEWEARYQWDLRRIREELERLEALRLLNYSKEDASRLWQSSDGSTSMNTWGPPAPAHYSYSPEPELAADYLADIYRTEAVMEEADLPPVYLAKKDQAARDTAAGALKRSAAEAGFVSPTDDTSGDRYKRGPKEDGLYSGATYAPRSLFDRPVNQQKMRIKSQQRAAQAAAQAAAAGLQISGKSLKYTSYDYCSCSGDSHHCRRPSLY